MSTPSIALILPLADAQKSRRTGSKATNLSKLVAARFAVPRGFVLSADAYRSHLWASGARVAASAQVDAEQREAIREAILTKPIPDDVWQSVAKAYERLSWQTGIPEPKVAVRSSAMELGGDHGFSGAYESYLNVSGLDALDVAIKRVWASLWSGKAAAYRMRQESAAEPAMAVIVQQMVEGYCAGTAYTANPMTGDPQSVCVSVRGESGTMQYMVALSDLSVTKAADMDDAAVDESLIRHIAEQSILIEDVIGGRVGIEWAVDRYDTWMLQAASIADLPAHFPVQWDNEADDRVLWTREDPHPVSYLARGLVAGTADRKILNGYLYSRTPTAQQVGDDRGALRARAKEIDDAADSLRDWQKHVEPELRERLKELSTIGAAEVSHANLIRHLNTAADSFRTSYEWMRRGRRMVSRLCEMLLEAVGDNGLMWRLVGGISDAYFERDALLQEMSERFAIAEQSNKLDDEKWWRSYKAGVEKFALSYGCAFASPGQAADPSRWKSWIEDTDSLFRIIGAISHKGTGTTLVTRHCAAEQDFRTAESEALRGIAAGKQSGLKRMVELSRCWIAARSQAEHLCELSSSMLRLRLIELAGKLEQNRAISSPDDVFLLSVQELLSISEQLDSQQRSELAAKIARRKHEAWIERRFVAPRTLPSSDCIADFADASFAGAPASPGTVSGHARVVSSIEDAAEIENGDVLIAAASGSVWTPFLAIAAGFICETGDEMSVEAIAARTYGIPAVMNCMGIGGTIRDAQKITLNGTSGVVTY